MQDNGHVTWRWWPYSMRSCGRAAEVPLESSMGETGQGQVIKEVEEARSSVSAHLGEPSRRRPTVRSSGLEGFSPKGGEESTRVVKSYSLAEAMEAAGGVESDVGVVPEGRVQVTKVDGSEVYISSPACIKASEVGFMEELASFKGRFKGFISEAMFDDGQDKDAADQRV
ncbi:hypothetical protein QJS10_CPA06g00553 [Acorus calamus]|uniref:Uncharacterized protein n=1 Tax=Acorus calamus TaxID=4465 RepID=A0AAV9EP12_ACOCL|nr:hypothetical protein QJS10_CPA06g00553 [Acorus calamus]